MSENNLTARVGVFCILIYLLVRVDASVVDLDETGSRDTVFVHVFKGNGTLHGADKLNCVSLRQVPLDEPSKVQFVKPVFL